MHILAEVIGSLSV